MNQQAFHAIRAARNWNMWGAFMAKAYAKKRNVHPSLVRLARQLEAMQGA